MSYRYLPHVRSLDNKRALMKLMPSSSDFLYSLIKIKTSHHPKKKFQDHTKILTIFEISSSLAASPLMDLSLTASHKNSVKAKFNSLVSLAVPYASDKTTDVVNTIKKINIRASFGLFSVYFFKGQMWTYWEQKEGSLCFVSLEAE